MFKAESQLTPQDQAYFEGIKTEILTNPEVFSAESVFSSDDVRARLKPLVVEYLEHNESILRPSGTPARGRQDIVTIGILTDYAYFRHSYDSILKIINSLNWGREVLENVKKAEQEGKRTLAIQAWLYFGVWYFVMLEAGRPRPEDAAPFN